MKNLPSSIDEFHYHEVMDRLGVLTNSLDNSIRSHIILEQYTELAALVDKAMDALHEAYQLAAKLRFEKFFYVGDV